MLIRHFATEATISAIIGSLRIYNTPEDVKDKAIDAVEAKAREFLKKIKPEELVAWQKLEGQEWE